MLINELDTPSVVIDLDIMERNLQKMQAVSDKAGVALRPHSKTHKIPELARKQIELGAVGMTVAKVGEAEVMVEYGVADILIAYPVVGKSKLTRLLDLAEKAKINVALDSVEVLTPLADAAASRGLSVGVLIEADTGFHRCGQPVGPLLLDLCRAAADLNGVEFLGIMTFLGHIWGGLKERQAAITEELVRMEELMGLLSGAGLNPETVSIGSTPNAELIPSLPGVTEMRPGTYIFNDRNTVGTEACTYDDCAMTVITTVVSTAAAGGLITDGGSKTFSSDRWLSGEGHNGFVPDDPGLAFVAMSEEHGQFDASKADHNYSVGDRIRIIPNHTCVVTNLHDAIYGVRGDQVEEMWTVAGRGRVK